jgi:serine/threonine-protein kinase
MGAVYRAFDPLIKRTLAIKTIRLDIPRQSPQHQAFIERFYQEARISGTLSHPSIVTLFDIGEESGVPFLAMELVDGKTIAAIIEEGTRFKPEKVIGLVSQVAAGSTTPLKGHRPRLSSPRTSSCTEDKVRHRPVSPSWPTPTSTPGPSWDAVHMSPSRRWEKLDSRSDIFSLGVVA